jgi:hypothetical protein
MPFSRDSCKTKQMDEVASGTMQLMHVCYNAQLSEDK